MAHLDFLRSSSYFCANSKISVTTLIPDQALAAAICSPLLPERAQIMAGLREQAGVQLALGCETVTHVHQRAAGAKHVRRNDWQAAANA